MRSLKRIHQVHCLHSHTPTILLPHARTPVSANGCRTCAAAAAAGGAGASGGDGGGGGEGDCCGSFPSPSKSA